MAWTANQGLCKQRFSQFDQKIQPFPLPKGIYFPKLTPQKTNMSPENQWLVQMYFLLKVRPFLGDIRSISGVHYKNKPFM